MTNWEQQTLVADTVKQGFDMVMDSEAQGWHFAEMVYRATGENQGKYEIVMDREVDERSAFERLCDELLELFPPLTRQAGSGVPVSVTVRRRVKEARQRHEAEQDTLQDANHNLRMGLLTAINLLKRTQGIINPNVGSVSYLFDEIREFLDNIKTVGTDHEAEHVTIPYETIAKWESMTDEIVRLEGELKLLKHEKEQITIGKREYAVYIQQLKSQLETALDALRYTANPPGGYEESVMPELVARAQQALAQIKGGES